MKRIIALVLTLCLLASTALAETSLTIMNGNKYDFLYEYLDRHEDVRIFMTNPSVFGNAFMNELITNPTYDVYQLTVGRTYVRLMEEGYLLPIEDEASLNWLSQTYPGLQEALTYEGKLYGLPVPDSLGGGFIAWAYDPERLEDAGLTELPATWVELLNMMCEWDEDSPYRLFGMDSVMELTDAIMDAYIMRYDVPDEVLSFDTAMFRDTMAALKRWQEVKPFTDVRPALLETRGIFFSDEEGYPDGSLRYIPSVTFLSGEEPIVEPDLLQVWCVSSRTKNPDAAMTLIAEAAEYMPQNIRFETIPGALQPVKDRMTQETVDQINALLPYLRIDLGSTFGDHFYELTDEVHRYLDGNLTLDMLVKRLDEMVEMVTLERS